MKKIIINLMTLCCFLLISGTIMGQTFQSMQINQKYDIASTKDAGVLFYFNLEDTSYNCLGAPETTLMMMNRFTQNELLLYDGSYLMSVLFLMADLGGEHATTGLQDVAAYVYEGGELTGSPQTNNPGTLLKQQAYTGTISYDSLNTIVFDNPILIDASKELWIGISAFVTSGYPLVADLETNFDNKGNIAAAKQGANWFFANVNQFMAEGESFNGDFAIIGIVGDEETGIDVLSFSSTITTLYPNPTNDRITLTEVENAHISIFDITGKVLYSQENVSSTHTVSVEDFTQGLYIVQIVKDGKITTKKFNIVR